MPIDAPTPAMPPIQPSNPAIRPQAATVTEPTDRWSALKQIGWWKPVDSIVIGILAAHIVSGLFFILFGKMTFNVFAIGMLQMILVSILWAVALIYRCMDFVVQLRANIEMLPFDSARIAVGYLQGGTPLNTPVPR